MNGEMFKINFELIASTTTFRTSCGSEKNIANGVQGTG